jgi:hypothetical protein
MNTSIIGELIHLRYKLLWAKTRSRNGKIALFMAGYLLLVLAMVLLSAGGFSAALLAVRSGQAEMVAQAVLSALYLEAVVASVMLGFGMNVVFSETELRRYPMTARDRFVARHFIGIVDPFWFLVAALELGLAVGLYVFGAASFWMGVAAVLLLLVSNYLLARITGLLVDRMMQRKSGSTVILAAILCLAMAPAALGPALKHHRDWLELLLGLLRFFPPFGAAAAIAGKGMTALYGLGLVLWWLLGLAAVLVALERRPAAVRTAQAAKVAWDGIYERMAAPFGPRNAPLVALWLRFYARNNRFRTLYLLTLPLAAFLTFNFGRRGGPDSLFLAALGTFPLVAFMGTSRIAVNQYGYVGGAFRRYFLLPTDPAASLRTGSYASLVLASGLIPVAAVAWILFAPGPFDARMLIMLIGSSLTGLFLFHGLGLWATLYGPRRGNYNSSMGNDLSFLGNMVVIGGVLVALALPRVLSRFAPAVVRPENWWDAVPAVLAALVFYIASLRLAGELFVTRRERLLAVLEGRD